MSLTRRYGVLDVLVQSLDEPEELVEPAAVDVLQSVELEPEELLEELSADPEAELIVLIALVRASAWARPALSSGLAISKAVSDRQAILVRMFIS